MDSKEQGELYLEGEAKKEEKVEPKKENNKRKRLINAL